MVGKILKNEKGVIVLMKNVAIYNNMDFMKEGLHFWVNTNWRTIFTNHESIWYDLGKFLENKHGGTLLVCPIMSHAKQQYS